MSAEKLQPARSALSGEGEGEGGGGYVWGGALSLSVENLVNVITGEARLGLRSKCHNNALYYVLTWSYVNLNPLI